MRLKIYSAGITVLFAALMTGCGVTTVVTSAHMTQPVLLGKITRIHEAKNEQLQLRVPFDISTSNSDKGYLHAGDRVSSEFRKLKGTLDDKVIVDTVYIGSYNILFLAPNGGGFDDRGWADIKGGIYRAQAAGHDAK